jgi:hypothetical protein
MKRAAALLEDLAVVLESCQSLGLVDLVFPHPQCSTTGVQPERSSTSYCTMTR